MNSIAEKRYIPQMTIHQFSEIDRPLGKVHFGDSGDEFVHYGFEEDDYIVWYDSTSQPVPEFWLYQAALSLTAEFGVKFIIDTGDPNT